MIREVIWADDPSYVPDEALCSLTDMGSVTLVMQDEISPAATNTLHYSIRKDSGVLQKRFEDKRSAEQASI